jgi:hypothetical protein
MDFIRWFCHRSAPVHQGHHLVFGFEQKDIKDMKCAVVATVLLLSSAGLWRSDCGGSGRDDA